MNTPQQPPKSNKKSKELKTEGPLSEKDEVKAAEERAAKQNKTVNKIARGKK